MCYTSGTTGNPKGVVYSHRSVYLHSMAACMGSAFGVGEPDRVLPVVPMFHANAWGLPYAAWMAGADMIMPDRYLQAEYLCPLMTEQQPTVVAGVPTVWSAVLRHAVENKIDISFLRTVICGGSAVPLSLMKGFQEQLGVRVVQAWGMTETSPLAAIAHPPAGVSGDEEWTYRARTGRVFAGVECRIVDDAGDELPADGEAVGEFEVRGPWVTGLVLPGRRPGALQPGRLAAHRRRRHARRHGLHADHRPLQGRHQVRRRVDQQRRPGEHADGRRGRARGGRDRRARTTAGRSARWPPSSSSPAPTVTAEQLRDRLSQHLARWQLPERWTFIDEVPKTRVGKFDKKVLRKQYADGDLDVQTLDSAPEKA